MRNRTFPAGGGDGPGRSSLLADPCHRRILALLREQSRPVTDRDIAVRIAGRRADAPPSDVAEEDVERLLVDLNHRYLPTLRTAGWIDRLPEGVVLTEEFPFGDAGPSLPPLRDSDVRWDVLAVLLARPRRRRIVATLARHDRPLALDELAAALAARDGGARATGDDDAVRRLLHHVDLPRLDGIGLIEYDPDGETASCPRALPPAVDRIGVDDDGEAAFEPG